MAEYMEYDWKNSMLSRDVLREKYPNNQTEPTDKSVALQELRSLLAKSKDYELKSNFKMDDSTLMKFLYARKFDLNETQELIENYYSWRRRNPEIFRNFTLDADDIKKNLENGLPGVLNSRDRKGRCVLILNAINWDFSYGLISIYRSILITLEYLINEVQNQANGFVVIVDWTEFTFRQSMNLKPSVLKLMIEGLQDCFPARFKGIHFIGQPWYVETAITFIKPFLKDKTKERIYVHGNNLSTLFEYVPRDILPTEMGGEQGGYNPQVWLKKMYHNQQIK